MSYGILSHAKPQNCDRIISAASDTWTCTVVFPVTPVTIYRDEHYSAPVNLPQLKCDAPIDAVLVDAHDRRDERRAPLELDL